MLSARQTPFLFAGCLFAVVVVRTFNSHSTYLRSDSHRVTYENVPGYNINEASKKDADGCYHVFLDVGANIGVHGRFLFEPEKYPEATKAHSVFDKQFGPKEVRDNRDICVFEIEANPRQKKKIEPKAEAYAKMGWRYELMNVAASDHYGVMEFNHNRDSASEEWGFSVKQIKDLNSGVEQVPTIRLADWLQEHVAGRKMPGKVYGDYASSGGPKVVMKLDIEGSEYVVIPDMITTGVMCSNIDFIFGEFHPKFAPLTFPRTTSSEGDVGLSAYTLKDREHSSFWGRALVAVINEARTCKTKYRLLDDEAYLHDGMPLPEPTN